MVIRPEDQNGDVLPVLASASLYTGINAEALLTKDRLKLLTGDWWENPAWGNAAVELLKTSRFTAADQQVLASYLSDYIRKTPGVRDVRDVQYFTDGRTFHYQCFIDTDNGSAAIEYNV